MVRLREEDFQRLKDAAKLLRSKGLDSLDLNELEAQEFVSPPEAERRSESNPAAAFTWGFVIGLGAAAIATLVAQRLKEQASETASRS